MSTLTQEVEALLPQLQEDFDGASSRLFEVVYANLRRLMAKILNEQFPILRGHTDDVYHTILLEFRETLRRQVPESKDELYRVAAFYMRVRLLDEVRKQRKSMKRRGPGIGVMESDVSPGLEPVDGGRKPDSVVAENEKAHEQVDQQIQVLEAILSLPSEDDLRQIAIRHVYFGVTLKEISIELGIPPRVVAGRWSKIIRLVEKHGQKKQSKRLG